MNSTLPAPRLFTFVGGNIGPWLVERSCRVRGEPLAEVSRVAIIAEEIPQIAPSTVWMLRGITSNERYVVRVEKTSLVAKQPALGRPAATWGALILLRKSAAWWALSQDERRAIFETQSRHIEIGLRYLPAVARRLHHCRDLGTAEPFDFITWFEFAPADAAGFDELVLALRGSPEWEYVDREVDLRLRQAEK